MRRNALALMRSAAPTMAIPQMPGCGRLGSGDVLTDAGERRVGSEDHRAHVHATVAALSALVERQRLESISWLDNRAHERAVEAAVEMAMSVVEVTAAHFGVRSREALASRRLASAIERGRVSNAVELQRAMMSEFGSSPLSKSGVERGELRAIIEFAQHVSRFSVVNLGGLGNEGNVAILAPPIALPPAPVVPPRPVVVVVLIVAIVALLLIWLLTRRPCECVFHFEGGGVAHVDAGPQRTATECAQACLNLKVAISVDFGAYIERIEARYG